MEVIVFLVEVYTAFFILYLIYKFIRKKNIPWTIVIINVFIIILFWYLEYLIDERKLSFLGKEKTSSDEQVNSPEHMNMGAGLGWFIRQGHFIRDIPSNPNRFLYHIQEKIQFDKSRKSKAAGSAALKGFSKYVEGLVTITGSEFNPQRCSIVFLIQKAIKKISTAN